MFLYILDFANPSEFKQIDIPKKKNISCRQNLDFSDRVIC